MACQVMLCIAISLCFCRKQCECYPQVMVSVKGQAGVLYGCKNTDVNERGDELW